MNGIKGLLGGLIVSCQAQIDGPLDSPIILSAMAKAAELGGAVGIRANLPKNIKAIKEKVNIPVIGIYKKKYRESQVYITPTFNEAKLVIDAGADIIAIDGTARQRPENITLAELVNKIKNYSSIPIMADIATLKEAKNSTEKGVDILATTLLTYTEETKNEKSPDFSLINKISQEISIPLFAEGNIHSPEYAARAIKSGADAIVVGTAITNTSWITEQFVNSIN